MKSQIKEEKGLKKQLEFIVPEKNVDACFLTHYQKLQKTVKIPGFRSGKVPLQTIKQNYKSHVLKDVMDVLFRTFYPQALKQHDIHPVGSPTLLNLDLDEAKDAVFLVELEVPPQVKVENYLNLELKKKNVVLKEKEIEDTLEKIRESYAKFEDSLLVTNPLKKGDFVALNLYAFNSQKEKLLNYSNLLLEIGKDMVAKDFDEKLLGLNVNQQREFDFLFPKNHQNPKIAGLNLKVEVTLTGFKNKKLPDLNDEFAKNFKVDTVQQLKDKVTEDLKKNLEHKQQEEVENQLIELLIQKNPVELPESLIENQKKWLKDNAKKRLEEYKVPAAEQGIYLEQHDKEFEKEAKSSVHISYIMETLIQELKIESSTEDITNSLKESFPSKKPEEMEKELRKGKYWDNFVFNLTRKKLMSYLIQKANIINE